MDKGFITIPILIIAILSTLVAGGGGYAVYKYTEVAKEKEAIETQLNEQKDKEIQRLQEQVDVFQDTNGTSTPEETVIEESQKPAEKKIEPVTTTSSKATVVPVVTEVTSPIETQEKKLTDKIESSKMVSALKVAIAKEESIIKEDTDFIEDVTQDMAEQSSYYTVQKTGSNLISYVKKTIESRRNLIDINTKLMNLHQSFVLNNAIIKEIDVLNLMKEGNVYIEEINISNNLQESMIRAFVEAQAEAYDAEAKALKQMIDHY